MRPHSSLRHHWFVGHGRFHHVQNSQKAKSICHIMQLVNSSCVLYDLPDFSASSDKTLQHSSLYRFQSAQAQNLANPSPSSLASVAINIIHACELLTSITLSTFYLKCWDRREDMVLKTSLWNFITSRGHCLAWRSCWEKLTWMAPSNEIVAAGGGGQSERMRTFCCVEQLVLSEEY